jgi:hypothetical protein
MTLHGYTSLLPPLLLLKLPAYNSDVDRRNFFRRQALDNDTLFETHILKTFHFDWHCSGIMDNSGFKVVCDGGEISHDCIEPVLSGFLYGIKICGSRGKTFQPVLVFWYQFLT